MKNKLFLTLLTLLVIGSASSVFAHCDTEDGPVVKDARKAIANNNVNYALKWTLPGSDKEIKDAFKLAMKVRPLGSEAKTLADKYFFETLVRIHRNGEGIAFTGVKPAGTPVDAEFLAADKSIELGNLSPLEKLVPKEILPELKERFDKVIALKDFDINNLEASRKYVEAYVHFFHFAEGKKEGKGHNNAESVENEKSHSLNTFKSWMHNR